MPRPRLPHSALSLHPGLMINGKQLEIPFEVYVQAARTAPETTSVKSLWAMLESTLSGLSDEVQLQIGAQAIAHLAEIVESKAAYLLEEWEDRYIPCDLREPRLGADLLTEVLRQSMDLDLTETVQVYAPPPRQIHRYQDPIQSVVQEIEKADLLELLDGDTSAYVETIAVAHDENASLWIGAIAHYLQTRPDVSNARISLLDLQQALNQPLIEVWLGLLLGESLHLEQIDPDFYSLNGLYIVPQPGQNDRNTNPMES